MHANIYLMHAFDGKDGVISCGAVLTKGMDMKEVRYVWHGVSIEKKRWRQQKEKWVIETKADEERVEVVLSDKQKHGSSS